MKSKLSFVAILTLFLVSLTFIILSAVKHTKDLKDKEENISELNTKVSTLEKSYNEKASEYNDLEIKYNELSSENERLVLTIEELEEQTVTTEEEVTEAVTEQEVVTTTQKKVEETTEAPEPKTEATTAAPEKEETTEAIEEPKEAEDGLQYSAAYDTGANRLTRSNGVVYYKGHKETWYSTNERCGQTTARSIPGKHVADDGTIRDADGYICVASSDLSFYTVVQTTLGPGKVYDCGCSHGTIDVYTNW